MNRKISQSLVIIASIGLALWAACLVVSLPSVMAAPPLQNTSPSSMENPLPQQAGLVPDSLLPENVVLPPVSTQNGLLPPDMAALADVYQAPPGLTSISQQNSQIEQPANTPTQIQAGEFAGINGAVCAYNTFTATLAAATDGDVIYINQGTWVGRIGVVTKNLTFMAASNNCTLPATSGVTIDGNDQAVDTGGVIEIAASKMVTLSYLTLTNGIAITGGIATVNGPGSLILDHSRLTNGTANNGGGVYMKGGNLILNNSAVFENTAEQYGGGIYAKDGPNINFQNNSQLTGNKVNAFLGMGGGLYITGNEGIITINSSDVLSNTASYAGGFRLIGDNRLWLVNQSEAKFNKSLDGWGGVILSSGCKVYVDDATLEKNTSGAEGGAIWVGDSLLTISDAVISNNSSANYGGGIFLGNDSTVSIDNSRIVENEAVYWGGGVYVAANVNLDIQADSHIDENETSDTNGIGGGMYIAGDNNQITVTASTVMSNTAQLGAGGIRLNGNSTLTLRQGTQVSGNVITGAGAGLATSFGTVEIDNVTFDQNSANGDGGAIWMESGEVTITDSSLTGNHSGDSGGGIFRSAGDLALYASTKAMEISDNDSTHEGGGIYDESGLSLIMQATKGWHMDIQGNTANYGGGVFLIENTSLQGSGDINFLDNVATISGGGMYVGKDATFSLSASSLSAAPDFLSNRATNEKGGAVYALNSGTLTLSGARVGSPSHGNLAPKDSGGGIFIQNGSLNLMDASFYDNQALGNGGAMALYTSTLIMESIQATIPGGKVISEKSSNAVGYCNPANLPADQYCSQFSNNTTSSNGGAVYLENSTASINKAAFFNNTANSGAAIYNLKSHLSISQVRVSDNQSSSLINPSIIYVDGGLTSGADTVLNAHHTTIVDNQGTAINYSLYTSGVFNNNIIWGNESRGDILPYATASCNNTQDRTLGTNNISQDPIFIVTSRGQYHLPYYSPSADVCTGATNYDLDGYPRPQGAGRDMGAFEAMEPRQFLSVVLR